MLIALASPSPAVAQTADQVRAALAEIERAGDLQQQLPSGAFAPAAPTRGGGAVGPQQDAADLPLRLPAGLKWLLLGIGLACGALVLVRALRDWQASPRGRQAAALPEPAPSAGAAPSPSPPGDDADALAAEGRLAEAVHRLLLDALELLRRRRELDLAASLTAREILRRARLPPAEGEALALLVGQVERFWFGRRVPSLDDYRRCREGVARLRGGLPA
jgi:hypothetical protein